MFIFQLTFTKWTYNIISFFIFNVNVAVTIIEPPAPSLYQLHQFTITVNDVVPDLI